MNAKFEKYWDDMWHDLDGSHASHTETWQAAIQSIEATPELVKVYCAAVNEHLGNLTKKQWIIERADHVGSIERAAKIGLTAVLSALKEQAK